jgi:hypothetical protein
MTFSPEGYPVSDLAAVNLVRNDFIPEVSRNTDEPVQTGQLIINLRAEAAPDLLDTAVRDALTATERTFSTLQAAVDHLERFRPGKPSPTHRFETAV